MGARDEPVVDGELIRQVSAFGDLDGVDLADEVGDRDVGCGELLAVAPIGRQPDELDGVAVVRDAILARRADRLEGIIVDLTSGDRRHLGIEELDQPPRDPGLRLSPLAEKDDVLP